MAAQAGFSSNGLPYARLGQAADTLVVFNGSELEHKPPSGLALKTLEYTFKRLSTYFTIFFVGRRPNLPPGYTAQQMSDDFAQMIRQDIGHPVDVMGVSSGGSSAFHFAVDHADLLNKLVLAMTAYRMGQHGIDLCYQLAALARAGKWSDVYEGMSEVAAGSAPMGLVRPMMRYLGATLLGRPKSGSDFAIVLDSDVNLDVRDKLAQIKAPTLVIAGDADPFYPAEIIRETAECIPGAQLRLIPGAGHKPPPKPFEEPVLQFLRA